MRAITHVHTSHSPDSFISVSKLVRDALKFSIDFLLISDHDSFEGSLQARFLAERTYPGRLTVPHAAEILTEHGDVIVAFDDPVAVPSVEALKRFDDLVSFTRQHGGHLILPHPYRGHADPDTVAAEVDAIEVFNPRCSWSENARAWELARRLGKGMSVGADAHLPSELRCSIAEYTGEGLAALTAAPRILRQAETFRYKIALCSTWSSIRRRRYGQALNHGLSFGRNLLQEKLQGQSRVNRAGFRIEYSRREPSSFGDTARAN